MVTGQPSRRSCLSRSEMAVISLDFAEISSASSAPKMMAMRAMSTTSASGWPLPCSLRQSSRPSKQSRVWSHRLARAPRTARWRESTKWLWRLTFARQIMPGAETQRTVDPCDASCAGSGSYPRSGDFAITVMPPAVRLDPTQDRRHNAPFGRNGRRAAALPWCERAQRPTRRPSGTEPPPHA